MAAGLPAGWVSLHFKYKSLLQINIAPARRCKEWHATESSTPEDSIPKTDYSPGRCRVIIYRNN